MCKPERNWLGDIVFDGDEVVYLHDVKKKPYEVIGRMCGMTAQWVQIRYRRTKFPERYSHRCGAPTENPNMGRYTCSNNVAPGNQYCWRHRGDA